MHQLNLQSIAGGNAARHCRDLLCIQLLTNVQWAEAHATSMRIASDRWEVPAVSVWVDIMETDSIAQVMSFCFMSNSSAAVRGK